MSASARLQAVGGPGRLAGNGAVAAAEQDARAVGRGAVVVVQLARLGAHDALGHQLGHQVVGERGGGDDAAADRHEPAPQPAVGAVGVAVGADDDVVGLHAPARGLDLEAAILWREAEHRRLARARWRRLSRPLRACRGETSPDAGRRCRCAPCRRSRSRCRATPRCSDARHRMGLDAELRAQGVGLARQAVVLGGVGGAGEAAGQLEVAVDAFSAMNSAKSSRAALASSLHRVGARPRRTWRPSG